MAQGFYAPRRLLERKPPHGSPCTKCGLCCLARLCEIGRAIFHQEAGPCPALQWDADKNASCGVVAQSPEPYKAAVLLLLNAGDGCDARFNGEPINHAFNAKMDALDKERADQIAAARDLLFRPAE
jgi:hypothetical protein